MMKMEIVKWLQLKFKNVNSSHVYTDTDFTGIICMLKYLTKSEENRLELILVLCYAERTIDFSENSVSV